MTHHTTTIIAFAVMAVTAILPFAEPAHGQAPEWAFWIGGYPAGPRNYNRKENWAINEQGDNPAVPPDATSDVQFDLNGSVLGVIDGEGNVLVGLRAPLQEARSVVVFAAPYRFLGGDPFVGDGGSTERILHVGNGTHGSGDLYVDGDVDLLGAPIEGQLILGRGEGEQFAASVEVEYFVSVGILGNAQLHVRNGASLASGFGYVGSDGNVATVSVTGEDSTWTIEEHLVFGVSSDPETVPGGTANLSIADGGVVDCQVATFGEHAGSNATLEVSGVGSRLVCVNPAETGGLVVGVQGSGIASILDGGTVECNHVGIADWAGSSGDMSVGQAGTAHYGMLTVQHHLDLGGSVA